MSKLQPPTKSQAIGLRALALGGIWEVTARSFFDYFSLQKNIFIFTAKISKKLWFGEAKMAPKIEFFELWRALVSDLNFSSFFFDFVGLGLGTSVKDF